MQSVHKVKQKKKEKPKKFQIAIFALGLVAFITAACAHERKREKLCLY